MFVTVSAMGEISPIATASYYNERIKDLPQGVYEWAEKDLLYVQVRIARAASKEDTSAQALLAQHRELLAWLAKKAGTLRKDNELPAGLDFVRRWVRINYPLWEYVADWSYQLDGQEFTREDGDEYVACAVCGRKAVESTMPPSFLGPIPEATWFNGGRKLVAECYVNTVNVPFMGDVGLLDGAEIFSTTNFDGVAHAKGTLAFAEYETVRAAMDEYLKRSELANSLSKARDGIRSIPPQFDTEYVVPAEVETKDVIVKVSTNICVNANVITNVSEVSFNGVSDIMPRNGTLISRRVRRDEAIITTVETVTVVKTRRNLVQKIRTEYFGEARFEDLFLSGGRLSNVQVKRTDRGLAAEKNFFASGTIEEHERAVLEALRENPGDKVLWNCYGRLLQQRKDWYGALICFRNALRLDHVYQYALTNLAITYSALGKSQLSIAAAFVAYGVADDGWCIKRAEEILRQ